MWVDDKPVDDAYLINKPFSAAGISDDNAQGWKIVRKINSWPTSEASRATAKFWQLSIKMSVALKAWLLSQRFILRTIFQPWTSSYRPKYQQAEKGFI